MTVGRQGAVGRLVGVAHDVEVVADRFARRLHQTDIFLHGLEMGAEFDAVPALALDLAARSARSSGVERRDWLA